MKLGRRCYDVSVDGGVVWYRVKQSNLIYTDYFSTNKYTYDFDDFFDGEVDEHSFDWFFDKHVTLFRKRRFLKIPGTFWKYEKKDMKDGKLIIKTYFEESTHPSISEVIENLSAENFREWLKNENEKGE